MSWIAPLTVADSSGIGGPTIHNEKDGTVDDEDTSGVSSTIPTFLNDGTLEVGVSVTLMVGNFTQSSTGTLQSDIAYDSNLGRLVGTLSASGTATLDGTVKGNLEDGYQPSSGTYFNVLTYSSLSGQFADVEPDGWTAEYDPAKIWLISS